MYDFVDRPRGDTDGAGHDILRNTHRLEVFFEENFAGGYGWLHLVYLPGLSNPNRPKS